MDKLSRMHYFLIQPVRNIPSKGVADPTNQAMDVVIVEELPETRNFFQPGTSY